jgi:hypothetical protein
MSSEEPVRAPVSEQTPLLRDAHPAHAGEPNGQESLAEERSTKELILILGSIWVGVFLAALGMFWIGSAIGVNTVLTEDLPQIRPLSQHCRHLSPPRSTRSRCSRGWLRPI